MTATSQRVSISRTVALLCVTWLIMLSGCMTPPNVKTAEVLSAQAIGVRPDGFVPILTPDWWATFGDPQLSQLIETGLKANPGLGVVAARLALARAAVALAQAEAGPSVGMGADARRQRFSSNGLVPAALAGATRSLANLQAEASWEIDFFGRHEIALKSALGAEQATHADSQAARVLLASDIARQYVQLARLMDERALTRRHLEQRETLMSLVKGRLSAGLDTNFELRVAQGPPAVFRQRIEALSGQIAQARNALAALSAQPPEALVALEARLDGLRPVELPLEVPADLLGRRADISAARWRIESAVQDVALARADFRPNVNLSALVGLSSIGLDRLLNMTSRQYGVGPAVHLPIFDSGRLNARLAGRAADLDVAIETYNQTLYTALREVLEQIGLLQSLSRQAGEQESALLAARAALEVNRTRYSAGLINRLVVMNSEATVFEQMFVRLELNARDLDARLALIRALGGGFVDPKQAAPTQAAPTQANVTTGN